MRIFTIIILILFFNNKVFSNNNIEIKILVDDEIITNIDLKNEIKYLKTFNKSLKKLDNIQLFNIARNSLIREKIKKKEIKKYFDLEKKNENVEKLVEMFYRNIGLKNRDEFIDLLESEQLNTDEILNKIKIESLWNELIYKRYFNQVSIDEDMLKKEIKEKISNQKDFSYEYNLSEIIFNLKTGETLEEKKKLIMNKIKEVGFSNTASIFSISDTSNYGGKIGWVEKNQLSKTILKYLSNIKVNDITVPIKIENRYLLLKINEIKETEKKINFNEEYKKVYKAETNRQLNTFSLIYFNKVKQNIFINDL